MAPTHKPPFGDAVGIQRYPWGVPLTSNGILCKQNKIFSTWGPHLTSSMPLIRPKDVAGREQRVWHDIPHVKVGSPIIASFLSGLPYLAFPWTGIPYKTAGGLKSDYPSISLSLLRVTLQLVMGALLAKKNGSPAPAPCKTMERRSHSHFFII